MVDALAMSDLAEAEAELRDEIAVSASDASGDDIVIELSSDEESCCDEPISGEGIAEDN